MEEAEISFNDLIGQAESALKVAVGKGGGKIVSYQAAISRADTTTSEVQKADNIDINLDEIVAQLAGDNSNVSNQQLASAMRKVLPLIAHADNKLKLGLSKVVLHLKKRLHH